jgi:hypothetical protein
MSWIIAEADRTTAAAVAQARRKGAAAAFVVLEKARPAPRTFLTAEAPPLLRTAGLIGSASGGGGLRRRGGLGSPRADVGE